MVFVSSTSTFHHLWRGPRGLFGWQHCQMFDHPTCAPCMPLVSSSTRSALPAATPSLPSLDTRLHGISGPRRSHPCGPFLKIRLREYPASDTTREPRVRCFQPRFHCYQLPRLKPPPRDAQALPSSEFLTPSTAFLSLGLKHFAASTGQDPHPFIGAILLSLIHI